MNPFLPLYILAGTALSSGAAVAAALAFTDGAEATPEPVTTIETAGTANTLNPLPQSEQAIIESSDDRMEVLRPAMQGVLRRLEASSSPRRCSCR